MNIAVFTNVIGGHHLEYIHHVYEMAINDSNNCYYFILPKLFNELKGNFVWMESDRIEFLFFDEDFDKATNSYMSQIVSSYKICKLIRFFINKKKCSVLYVNTIIGILPLAPLLLSFSKCKVIGIIYKIYLYDKIEKKSTLLANKLKYTLLSRCALFSKVLVLNDTESASKLNSLYSTKKFLPIPDPYVKLPTNNIVDIRRKYNIGDDKVVFSHIGALSINKSTIEILLSLNNLSEKEKCDYVFIFAGVVQNEIKQNFYNLYKSLKKSINIIVEDKYCTYEELASFCIGSDALLIPYKRTSQSSGIIGYASQFGCPVIAPSNGLLGNLVRKYELGVIIDTVSTESLIGAYRRIANKDYVKPSLQYCKENNVAQFQQVIRSCIEPLNS